jgi:ribosome-associated protein
MARQEDEKTFEVNTEFITLGQFLKACNLVNAGGEVKAWLEEEEFLVNGEPEIRRGRKLRPGDTVRLPDRLLIRVIASEKRAANIANKMPGGAMDSESESD